MNLAFIIKEFPGDRLSGGIGTYVGHLLPSLARLNHRVVLFTAISDSSRPQKFEWNGVSVINLGARSYNNFDREVLSAFLEIHGETPFDTVETSDFGGWGWQVFREVSEKKKVVVLHTASFLLEQSKPQPSLRQQARRKLGELRRRGSGQSVASPEHYVLKTADIVIAPTRSIVQATSEVVPLSGTKIHTVPLPFTPWDLTKSREILSDEKRPKIVFVGRLAERKGILVLVEALQKVLPHAPSWEVVMMGRDTFLPSPGLLASEFIKRELAPYMERVDICGQQPPSAVRKLLEESEVAVFPSTFESFGYVCVEAMYARCAVVVSAGTGMSEVLVGLHYGRTFPIGNSSLLAEELRTLIASKSLRRSLGEAARERVIETFDPQKIAQERSRILNRQYSKNHARENL